MYGINGEIMLDYSTQCINCQMEHLILEEYMESIRTPTQEELNIIGFLMVKANYNMANWADGLMVRDIPGGMGSIELLYNNIDNYSRKFGKQISEICFKDIDDIDVIVSLYVDENNLLYELDVWKVNFSNLIQFPNLH